jgi:hypothetical protein
MNRASVFLASILATATSCFFLISAGQAQAMASPQSGSPGAVQEPAPIFELSDQDRSYYENLIRLKKEILIEKLELEKWELQKKMGYSGPAMRHLTQKKSGPPRDRLIVRAVSGHHAVVFFRGLDRVVSVGEILGDLEIRSIGAKSVTARNRKTGRIEVFALSEGGISQAQGRHKPFGTGAIK